MTEKTVEKSHSIKYRYADGHLGTTRTISMHASPEEIQHFVEQGFLYRDQLFPAGLVSRLRLALDEVAEMERTRGNADSTDARFGGLFIRHLYDKHPAFPELIDYPPMVSVARALLGPAVQSRLSARISVPGQLNQQTQWHYHQALVMPDPAPPLANFPHSIDILVYLDDVTEANGPLALVPGSHRFGREIAEDDYSDKPDQKTLCLTAGDGVFIHNNLWHRGLPTRPDGTLRRLLAFSYSPVWLKNVNDGAPPADGLTKSLHTSKDREIRELLGLDSYR